MKKILFLFILFISFSGFAQDDYDMKGNTVTVREKAPVWPGCERAADKDKCFNEKLIAFVKTNYHYPKNDKGEFIRGKAIISLEVDKDGKVIVHSVEGEHPEINKEAKRMVESMPEMIPGSRSGKPVPIKMKFPMNF